MRALFLGNASTLLETVWGSRQMGPAKAEHFSECRAQFLDFRNQSGSILGLLARNGARTVRKPTPRQNRELLLGTWIAMALVVEALISHEPVEREDLLLLLSDAEAVAHDQRRTAIAALRLLIERGFG